MPNPAKFPNPEERSPRLNRLKGFGVTGSTFPDPVGCAVPGRILATGFAGDDATRLGFLSRYLAFESTRVGGGDKRSKFPGCLFPTVLGC
ncbi:MAG: hypothetical protein CL912_16700 [Deltaproteobacteria bacterium]|nr:hypothetical protein [Deltaproteobacteria bacterium]